MIGKPLPVARGSRRTPERSARMVRLRTSLGILLSAIAGCVSMAGANPAQDRPSVERGCVLIDKSHAPQSILYEDRFESSSTIDLRLRNNTSCPIVVETDDTLPTPIKKLPNGGMRIEPVFGSEDGVRVRLHCLLQDRQSGVATKRGYGLGIHSWGPGGSVSYLFCSDDSFPTTL